MADGQTLKQTLQLQILGTQQMVSAIKQLENSNRKYSEALLTTRKNQNQNRESARKLSDQGLANIQAGLVQLSTYLLNMNVKINNVFESMQKGFAKTETAMNLLKSTMGLAGETEISALGDFTKAEDTISRLAMTTEYTKAEIAGAFQSMKQDGLSLDDTLGVIGDTLQFATASGGMLSLEEAAKITTLTFKTLGGDTKNMGKNLNSLYKVTTDTSLGFDGIRESLSGLRIGAQYFAKSELREATINTFIAALMEGGESAANAGLKFKNFGGSILSMYNNLKSLDRKLQATGKLSKRSNLKNIAIQRLTGASDLDIGYINKALEKNYKSVADALKYNYAGVMRARNEYAIEQLFTIDSETGKRALKSVEDFGTDLLNRYRQIAKQKGVVEAQATLKQAFGTESGSQTIKALDLFLKKRGTSLKEYAKGINNDLGELDRAQADALKTLDKRIKLSESAESALSEAIFKHDVYARAGLDTYTELVKATGTLMTNNQTLASTTSFLGRSLQMLTGIGTNLGFMLTASATFSIALRHSMTQAGGAAKGLGATMSAFGKVFLAPTLAVVVQLTGGLFLLGVAIVAVMKYFSGAETIGEGFAIILERIKNAAKSVGGLFQAMFSKDLQGKSVKELSKQFFSLRNQIDTAQQSLLGMQKGSPVYTKQEDAIKKLEDRLNSLNSAIGTSGREGMQFMQTYGLEGLVYSLGSAMDIMRSLFMGFGRIAEGMLVPVMMSLHVIFTLVGGALNLMLMPFKFLAVIFSGASDEASVTAFALRLVGGALGILLSGMLIFKSYTFFTSMITLMGTKFKALTGSLEGAGTRLNKMSIAMNSAQNTSQKQLTFLERLKLKYDALRGKVDNYNRAVSQSTSVSDQFLTKKQALVGTLSKMNTGLAAAGAGFLTVGAGIKSFSQEGSALYGIGDALTTVGGAMLFLIPIIQLASTVMTVFGLSVAAAFGWIAGIGLAIYGLASLFSYFSDSTDTEETASLAKTAEATPIKTINQVAMSTQSTMDSLNSGNAGTYSSSPSTTQPMVNNSTSYYANTSSAGGSTQNIKENVQGNKYNISNLEIKVDSPEEVSTVLANLQADGIATGTT